MRIHKKPDQCIYGYALCSTVVAHQIKTIFQHFNLTIPKNVYKLYTIRKKRVVYQ